MQLTVIWSPAAEYDLLGVLKYLEENWNEKVIDMFLDKVEACENLISADYKIFPLINAKLKIRKCVVTKHNTLFYRQIAGQVEIIRLFGTKQDPMKAKFT